MTTAATQTTTTTTTTTARPRLALVGVQARSAAYQLARSATLGWLTMTVNISTMSCLPQCVRWIWSSPFAVARPLC